MLDFIKTHKASRSLLLANIFLAGFYFVLVVFLLPKGDSWLFWLLVASEVFHFWQVATYIFTVWPRNRVRKFNTSFQKSVAIFITVAGEPKEIVRRTVQAAKELDYPHFNVYILNDGFVAKKDNWQEAEDLANELGVTCITRQKPGGAKAGNLNHALRITKEPFIAVFDADHIPKPHFLTKMMGYFTSSKVGFVQSPQYYYNQDQNYVAGGSWEQQTIFFGAICKGKEGNNAAFMCGTNMALRRKALDSVGGMNETNIAEDFLTSLLIHEKKWDSVYVDEVLAEGLAPEDFITYQKQQFRWARGSLEVVLKFNPLFRKGTTWRQKIEYLAASSFYLSGFVVLLNAVMPLVFFYGGAKPLEIDTMTLALVFLPYIITVLYTIQATSNFSYTFRALSFTLSSFWIHITAFYTALRGKKSSFVITSKKRLSTRSIKPVVPHLIYIVVAAIGLVVALNREGLSASVLSNLAWVGIYITIFVPFILSALRKEEVEEDPELTEGGVPQLAKNEI